MTKTITIRSCDECPYLWQGAPQPICRKAERLIGSYESLVEIPDWCPLPDAHLIATNDRTGRQIVAVNEHA